MSQLELQSKLAERSESPPYELVGAIPESIQQYVANSFHSRFTGRVMANCDNYDRRVKKDHEGVSDEVIAMFENALTGTASPAELLYVRQVYGIASAELGCITLPYGKGMAMLDEMRDSVSQAILLLGGEILSDNRRFAVKSADLAPAKVDGHPIDALLMTRKRDIGEMQDGTIVRERASFILRIDEASRFNQKLAAKIGSIDIHAKDWESKVGEIGELPAIASASLDANDFAAAIPLSATIFAFNPEQAAEIKREQALEENRKKLAIAAWREHFRRLS